MIAASDQVLINELRIEMNSLYDDLISKAENDDYDIDEIESINSDIDDIDQELSKIYSKYVKCLKKRRR